MPASISDNTLNYASRYRSRARIPVLTYLHPVNNCSITRCSQPLVGVRQNRSIQDEKLLAAIFSTTRNERPLSQTASPAPEREDFPSYKDSEIPALDGDLNRTDTEELEDAVISKLRGDDYDEIDGDEKKPLVYGAQQRNMIIDARPTVNAYAMQAVGLGSENMDHYKFATKAYLGIDNIHVMRESLNKVVDALKDSDLTPLPPNRELLQKSNWLKHIANMLDGVGLIARQVGLQHSHVLIHCSDGWDRTSQLSSLSQLCLDPYYRTIDGFIVLVEKDWLSFGHMFKHRSGFLSSEKWFQIENERIGGGGHDPDKPITKGNDAISGAQRTFENAFLSAKTFFSNKASNDSRDSLNIDSDVDGTPTYDSDNPSGSKRLATGSSPISKDKSKANSSETKVKETAPIFHQFLDATYQLLYQHPTRFEFNSRFLRRLLYHLYSCQYGSFLFDNEKSRTEAKISERTRCVWDYFLSRRQMWLNPQWDGGVIDDKIRGKERLIFPRPDEVRWWAEGFGRSDEEMNGLPPAPAKSLMPEADLDVSSEVETPIRSGAVPGADGGLSSLGPTHQMSPRAKSPVLIGVETSEEKIGVAAAPAPEEAKTAHSDSALARNVGQDTQSLSSDAQKTTDTNGGPQASATAAAALRQEISTASPTQEATQDDPAAAAAAAQARSSLAQVSEDPLADLSDDLDPLGIGEVKDRAPRVVNRSRLREQMEILMQ